MYRVSGRMYATASALGSGGLLLLELIYPAQVWRMRHLEALRSTFHEGRPLTVFLTRAGQGFQPG